MNDTERHHASAGSASGGPSRPAPAHPGDRNPGPAGKSARGFFIRTWGCQMNVHDSERMAEVLEAAGWHPVDRPEDAGLILLNTCHIREKAAEKVYSEVGRLRALKRDARETAGPDGGPLIGVVGCVAQAEGEEIQRRAPAVDLVVGSQSWHRLPELLVRAEAQRRLSGRARVVETDFPAEDRFSRLPARAGGSRRPAPAAFVTIQEGCDKFCTFCVVPYTRGAEMSRPVAAIEEEVRRLVDAGVVEVTLLGQNVNAYHGRDEKGRETRLADLIARLARIEGLARIRYTTSHPRDMDDALIAAHGGIEKLMPYLHLPIQAGSDRVLAAMNRRHRVEEYLEIVEKLRAARPDIALSGDFIVGFPGETDEDFERTLALVRRVGYAQAYSFKYSPRPGTPAADADGQVPEEVKAERLARLQDLLAEQQAAFNAACVGRRFEVLFERPGRGPGQWLGRSPYNQAVHLDLDENASDMLDSGPRLALIEVTAGGPHSLGARLVDSDAARHARADAVRSG